VKRARRRCPVRLAPAIDRSGYEGERCLSAPSRRCLDSAAWAGRVTLLASHAEDDGRAACFATRSTSWAVGGSSAPQGLLHVVQDRHPGEVGDLPLGIGDCDEEEARLGLPRRAPVGAAAQAVTGTGIGVHSGSAADTKDGNPNGYCGLGGTGRFLPDRRRRLRGRVAPIYDSRDTAYETTVRKPMASYIGSAISEDWSTTGSHSQARPAPTDAQVNAVPTPRRRAAGTTPTL
jgi:hypothetical protein